MKSVGWIKKTTVYSTNLTCCWFVNIFTFTYICISINVFLIKYVNYSSYPALALLDKWKKKKTASEMKVAPQLFSMAEVVI